MGAVVTRGTALLVAALLKGVRADSHILASTCRLFQTSVISNLPSRVSNVRVYDLDMEDDTRSRLLTLAHIYTPIKCDPLSLQTACCISSKGSVASQSRALNMIMKAARVTIVS